MRTFVTLLTDFGTADGYVAEMKGVLLAAAPDAVAIDASHEIPPHDVEAARLALARYWRRYPAGSVHVVVVDPGVGSSRAALAIESDGRFLVGPDNGVLSPALLSPGARAVALRVAPNASPTFHGRDVFAPAAARLALGDGIDLLGDPSLDPLVRRTPEAHRRADGAVEGEVITIDRFGNCVTNLMTRRGGVVDVGTVRCAIVRAYDDGAPGAPIALVGSSGLVEIAVRGGSAAQRLGLRRGSRVALRAEH